MASIQYRTSRGKKYWSIVESRRINGNPRTVILEYLGTAATLLQRLQAQEGCSVKSYSHGDTAALIEVAKKLDIVNIINKHVPNNKDNKQPKRDNLTVGASFLLAAIGRACQPTSKLGWYDWCKTTSLEYCLKNSFKKLDSQHFWDQMNALPQEAIPLVEEDIVTKLIEQYNIKLDCLFFDTTNFFTFIDSLNTRCDLPQRGRNKQKRFDLRQIGMALLVSRKEQFPLFHQTYRGNKNDITTFKETFDTIFQRIKKISNELSDITIVFDKGNNSKDNFKKIDQQSDCYYVGGLVSSHFKELIEEANKNFTTIKIDDDEIPVYQLKTSIWNAERTCVITVSSQLKEGQIKGIHQHLEKKYKSLKAFKQQLENPKRKKNLTREDIAERLKNIIQGQFIKEILKYEFIKLAEGNWSFTYFINCEVFNDLKDNILGRQIIVTNHHEWTAEEIILAYRGQSKVEYAFRNLKNPYHLAVRPQYHWTDQKIAVHFLICVVGYLLSIAVYTTAKHKAAYKKNMHNLMNDLRAIRLACIAKKKSNKLKFQIESFPKSMHKLLKALNITNDNLKPKLNLSDYK